MAGRPNKYFQSVQPHLDQIKIWISQGVTDKDIANRLGINSRVFCKYKHEFNELNELYLNTKKEVPYTPVAEDRWCVYKHTFPNNKVYIGITSQEPKTRWSNGKGYSKNTYVRSAIEKYGWENIKHEILFDGLSEAEAKAKEIQLIEEFSSSDPKKGYNLTKGGEGAKLTPEQKRKRILKRKTFGIITFAQNVSDVLARLETVEKLSKEGTTKEEIANMFGVSRTTWYTWEKEESLIQEAIDSGRIEAVKDLKAALFKRATGFQYTETKVTEDNEGYWKKETFTKTALPDPTSAMMLLRHWDKETEWTNDPAQLELKKQEFEWKKQHAESGEW